MTGIQELLAIPPGIVETPEEEAVLSLLRTAELLQQHSRHTLFSDGTSQAWFNVLMILSHEPPRGVSQNTIASRLITTKGNLSQHLAQMEEAGLVRRRPGDQDRRLSIVSLTRKGRRRLARLEPLYRAQVAGLFDRIPRSEVRALIRGLDRLRDNLPTPLRRLKATA